MRCQLICFMIDVEIPFISQKWGVFSAAWQTSPTQDYNAISNLVNIIHSVSTQFH